ncbi:subtilisin-like serine protease QhpE [Bacillus sp. FJAT-45350]|uniref:subtilisin-like serine protease QhpE n=1 Tax=Bacillus sp. FJAT-45350 TaxID=2011014 RepID=UPI000BB9A148|nr:S8 family serine peptidase [Bacillus sp. FJAT-45350]
MKKKQVKIGVIDSGINPYHSHIGEVNGGISISVGKDMYLEWNSDFRDRLGHGTAVAAAIRDEMPDCELYAIRIFNEQLTTYPTVLCAALEWAIAEELDIINLSLGVMNESVELKQLCQEAKEKGIFVVAALDEDRGFIYPARYEGVLAVSAGEYSKGEFEYSHDNCFRACGYPKELNGDIQRYNLHGHSFASARFTGMIGKTIKEQDEKNYSSIYELLIKEGLKNK